MIFFFDLFEVGFWKRGFPSPFKIVENQEVKTSEDSQNINSQIN